MHCRIGDGMKHSKLQLQVLLKTIAGLLMKSQIWDLVPNGTKVQIWSQKSPNFACKSQIAIREPQNGQKQPQNAINRTYEAISGSGGSKLVVQGWYKTGNITEKWSPKSVNFALNVVTTRFLKPFCKFCGFFL